MRRGLIFIAAGLLLATAADAKGPIDDWQGVYKRPMQVELVDGTTIPDEDLMEIVRVDPAHAYVNLDLNFANAHTCTFRGVMVEETKQLVYRGFDDRAEPNQCILWLERYSSPDGAGVVIHEVGNGCRGTCGARDAFDGGRFAMSLRDASETTLEAVRQSRGYQRAIEEQTP